MEPHDQRTLAAAAQSGDADAWESLYVAVHPRLRGYLVRRVGASEVDDVLNETMVRAVAAIGRFRWESAGFDGWLFGIARRTSAEHVRRAVRNQRVPPIHEAAAPDFDEALVLANDHAVVRRAFDALRSADRELLELRVVAGLSAEQVAVALGKRPGAIRTAQSRAIARLRSLLEEMTDDGS